MKKKMKNNNLTYAIISIDDLPKVDFSQVSQTSMDSIRRSVDLTKFILKWEEEPSFIDDGTIIPIGQYTHHECLELMSDPEWTKDLEE
tara:strand:+ start:1244 stop:1507 length:264 start_codon:yes stop_codon:yes gene_type:complete